MPLMTVSAAPPDNLVTSSRLSEPQLLHLYSELLELAPSSSDSLQAAGFLCPQSTHPDVPSGSRVLGSWNPWDMQRQLRVPMSQPRGQNPKLPPPVGIWGTNGNRSWRHFLGQIPEGHLTAMARGPSHQTCMLPKPAFWGPEGGKPLGWEMRDVGFNPGSLMNLLRDLE